jgi:hypothetical protein
MRDKNGLEAVADTLRAGLISPNVMDSNMESANVVDALDKVAWSIGKVADALHRIADVMADK